MKKIFLFFPVLILLIVSACDSDYRPMSIGAIDEVIVVMDSTQWDSETALALEETFGKPVETLPSPESTYRLIFRDFRNNSELDQLRNFKNIIFATPIDAESNVGSFTRALISDDVETRVRSEESFAFPLEDRWVRDQWVLVLTSTSDELLAEKIRNSESSLVGHLLERELEDRTNEVFRRGEQTALSDSLWNKYGWKVRMQHDYIQTYDADTSNVVVFARHLQDNSRRMWAWWEDDIPNADFITPDWINAKRDSLMELYLRGERDSSYVTTQYRRPVNTSSLEREDRLIGFETLGTWTMTNDFMGGPFVNFTWYDPESERLFMVEYWQFAPSVDKRRFVRQFRAMGRTFQSDPDWPRQEEEPISELLRESD